MYVKLCRAEQGTDRTKEACVHSISDQQAQNDKKIYRERDIGDIREVVELKFEVLSSAAPEQCVSVIMMLLKRIVIYMIEKQL